MRGGRTTANRRLGDAIRSRRTELGIRTASDLARMAEIGKRTTELIEAGSHPGTPRPSTLERIDRALGWRAGSAQRLLENGTTPEPLHDGLWERLRLDWPHLSRPQRLALVQLAATYRKDH